MSVCGFFFLFVFFFQAEDGIRDYDVTGVQTCALPISTYLAEEYGFPAVLINPAVRPFELWQEHLGRHRNYYTDEIHTVTKKHIEELKELDRSQLQYPRNYMVLLQSGDEVLDYTQAREKFESSRCIVRENGSHSYEDFADELPAIFDFLLSRID